MKSKKAQKIRKKSRTMPEAQKTSTAVSMTLPAKTIKQAVIESITANSNITNNEMIAAVKAQFPESTFNARHASWYRSQARKGLLTGTPVNIPAQTKRCDPQYE